MGRKAYLALLAVIPAVVSAGQIEILRDRWGVPHIYASNTADLFYAQGYFAAKDRLFQLDLWRRQNTGHLAEIMGEAAIGRDRIARLVRYRGNWDTEWRAYSPDAREIATTFAAGINAYIRSLNGKRPPEFEVAGYDPGTWQPEDVAGRVAGLLMTRNVSSEIRRSANIKRFGLDAVQKLAPPEPMINLKVPNGLDLNLITASILRDYNAAIATPRWDNIDEQGSNNWVVDGTMTATGKPLLANDPHRPVVLPSLRKTWHLVAPGINVYGAGEPALPGIALGHNDNVAWGFTIVGIDQQDLYVEKLNPANPDQYRYKNEWKPVEVEHQALMVKGKGSVQLELRYTLHGPIIFEDRAKHVAYALRWTGAEPGGAGYLSALGLMRAKSWAEFRTSVAGYKVPSENLVYADRAGNIGWIAAGAAPIRANWSGLLPVPGDSGEYEWRGYLSLDNHPQKYNPKDHFIATANHNILPETYPHVLGYEWTLPYRVDRIREVLSSRKDWDRIGFERLQQDVESIPARRFLAVLRRWGLPGRGEAIRKELLLWDGKLRADSRAALIYELWMNRLPKQLFGEQAALTNLEATLRALESADSPRALSAALNDALDDLDRFPKDRQQWGALHTITLTHPTGKREWSRGPVPRPGDAYTVNASSGANFRQSSGASYRQIIDLSDWDKSVMTNVPGESGDPTSPHYSDLVEAWATGQYHPMVYSRKAVEAATEERFVLKR